MFNNPSHPGNFVTCVKDVSECPITSITLRKQGNQLAFAYNKQAVSLPILKVMLRSDFPCLRTGYTSGIDGNYFRDEVRRDMTPCPRHSYFETRIDTRYDFVAGSLSINQETFEEQNGLAAIWADRYADN